MKNKDNIYGWNIQIIHEKTGEIVHSWFQLRIPKIKLSIRNGQKSNIDGFVYRVIPLGIIKNSD